MPSSNYEHAAIEPTSAFSNAAAGGQSAIDMSGLEEFLANVANSRDSLTIGLE